MRVMLAVVVAFLFGTVSTGCLSGARPAFDYGPDGTPLQVKRTARIPRYDEPWRMEVVAYDRNRGSVRANSPEQAQLLEELGQPDYTRRQYRSTRGDRVTEWAYLEKNRLIQFVHHAVVYDGILSDKDRILIQYGYPDAVFVANDLLGQRRETFIYHERFDSDRRHYSFADDQMIYGIESY